MNHDRKMVSIKNGLGGVWADYGRCLWLSDRAADSAGLGNLMATRITPQQNPFEERFLFVILAGKPMDAKLIEWLCRTERPCIILPQKYLLTGIA